MKSRRLIRFALLLAWLVLPILSTSAEDWPNWRGPRQDGSSKLADLPLRWADGEGVVWTCELPEWGNSTPITWGDAIFLTSQTDEGDLLLIAIDATNGRIVWTRTVGQGETPRGEFGSKVGEARRHQKFHPDHNLAGPSVATDGDLVICHFGNGLLAAFDFDGKELWQRNLQADHGEFSIWWGHANSPVLRDHLVFSVNMQDTCADLEGERQVGYVVAHDKRTGEMQWFSPRDTEAVGEHGDSYTTPLLWDRGDRTELVVWGGQILDAYEPTTGRRLWWFTGLGGNRVITGPVIASETIIATEGMRRAMMAFRPTGTGERPPEEILWRQDQSMPDSPTPTLDGNLLFAVNDRGIAQCVDIATGEAAWRERIPGLYRASPLAAGGRIYFRNTEGLVTIVAASNHFEVLAENQLLQEGTFASPVPMPGRILLRGRKTLVCVGKK